MNAPEAGEGLETIAGDPEERGFTFASHPNRVTVSFNGVTVAASDRARMMRESRLAPVIYFPPDDVHWEYLEKTGHRTFCPFKGNASYWSLDVSGERAENAAWSYEEPFDEAEHIGGYVAFYANLVDILDAGEDAAPGATGAAGESNEANTNPLLPWLLNEAPGLTSTNALTEGFARALQAVGIPVWRLAVIIRTLHPQVLAESLRWWAKRPTVDVLRVPYTEVHTERYLNSPLVPIFDGAGGIRRRLDIPDPVLDFGILEELHREGATDYVAMPITFLDGQINVLTLASDRPGGFSTAELGHVYEILGQLGRLYELHNMRRTAVTLLDTYLGRHAGERVLTGSIKRGDGENIEAVIWFCDLRESTPLAQSMSQEEFLGALNQFFDCMAGAVLEHGGQVLRFIGDAALAIFPMADGDAAARARTCALAAAVEANRRIGEVNEKRVKKGWKPFAYGLGLHAGQVTYGNIGTPDRLEFTVVGDAANYAARLESLCKTLQRPVLASAEFARHFPERFESMGMHDMRGIQVEQEIFSLRI
jgi:class 3 adenylate cyclase/uncharacterized protein (DUF427 family)